MPEQKGPHILIVTSRFDPHSDIVIHELDRQGVPFTRFNTEMFPGESTITYTIGYHNQPQINLITTDNPPLGINRVTSAWYRRPEPPKFENMSPEDAQFATSESQAVRHGLYSLADCLWVNHPDKIKVAERKMFQLAVARKLGFPVPDTIITNNPDDARAFLKRPGQKIIKCLTRGLIIQNQEFYAIYTNEVEPQDIEYLDQIHSVPVLLQNLVPKSLDLRVTVIGNQVFATEIHSQDSPDTSLDWRRYTEKANHLPHTLPLQVEQACLQINHFFDLSFSAIDLVLTPDGEYVFLEVNPNGQWAWVEDLTGQPLTLALVNLLTGTL